MPPDISFTLSQTFKDPFGPLTTKELTASIRSASRSLRNRLHSIYTDSQFVNQVHSTYKLPLVVNKRAGEWYVDPRVRDGAVYFKSTDGHTGNWGFSPRRLNLHLLDIVRRGGGALIVDSTRRGKRYPDSISKTIPIWCAVINQALFPSKEPELFTPPRAVSVQEHARIKALIPTFVEQFCALNISIPEEQRPKKPLRPLFITPDDFFDPTDTEDVDESSSRIVFEDYSPLVLVTASRMVKGMGIEGEYIQGAGDDAENWLQSYELTPSIFWLHHKALLAAQDPEEELTLLFTTNAFPDEDIPAAHSIAVRSHTDSNFSSPACKAEIDAVQILSTGIHVSISKNAIASFPLKEDMVDEDDISFDIIIDCRSGSYENKVESALADLATAPSTKKEKPLGCFLPIPTGKKAAKALRENLPKVRQFLRSNLSSLESEGMHPNPNSSRKHHKRILIQSDEPGDISVAVALFILCLWFGEEQSRFLLPDEVDSSKINKPYIRRKLAWIVSSLGELCDVSRANLIAINSVLMDRR